jgi:hypothetical protein
MTEENTELWNAVKGVDRNFTKKITGKSYSGDSPNPTYIIQKITEQLGPIGRQWGFRIVKEQIVDTVPHVVKTSAEAGEIVYEKMHYVEIEFWQEYQVGNLLTPENDKFELRTFSACGGTKLLYKTRKGQWVADEDAPKKSLTDAYVKAASWLGVCADLFLGLFDDRYGQIPEADTPPKEINHIEGEQTTSDPWG